MRARRALLLVLLCVAALAAADARDVTLNGTVTINGTAAQQGVRILARSGATQQDCGLAMVGLEGAYSMPLVDPCLQDTAATVILLAAPNESPVSVEQLTSETGTDLPFANLSDAALSSIALDAAATGTPGGVGDAIDVVDPGTNLRPESLLGATGLLWLLITIFVATIVLLGVIVVARWRIATRPLDMMKNAADWTPEKTATLQHILGDEGGPLGDRVFPRFLIEGLVLALVVIALLVLGSAGRITQEGLVSVLAAIVGYAAGRAVESK